MNASSDLSSTERMTQERFKELVDNRTIYIFSVNLEGIGLLRRFTHMGLEVGGFIDSRPYKRGKPVIPPSEFFAREDHNVFVVITAKHRQTRRWAIDLCTNFGLEKNVTFLTSTTLCDYLARSNETPRFDA